jgi:hypothetical protein
MYIVLKDFVAAINVHADTKDYAIVKQRIKKVFENRQHQQNLFSLRSRKKAEKQIS